MTVDPCYSTLVFNHAATLARDVIEADKLTDGWLQIGPGAGYLREEFEAVGAKFSSGGQHVEALVNDSSGWN
jgi:hypothetical protein